MLNYRLGAFFAPALTLFKVTGEWLFDVCGFLGAHIQIKRTTTRDGSILDARTNLPAP
jgi:hypothetical protein